MNKFAAAALIMTLPLAAAPVEAKGCIKGMIAGGVAGHYAGHHAVAGAMAGCVAGHYIAKHATQKTAGTQTMTTTRVAPATTTAAAMPR